mmetsp:Transcript_26905/g.75197  ORF Transcript_26905/g.75197 Transcript_26905/m.75197 type:complete len:108 (+) Transcript_26905:243-566(+)|eukprot:CAMPEP_0119144852 /NCGR_PEP_ID=MMETSP1310-20130426/36610_1 /TAXON_ID=464262 /ORGANISM="Genus nov. species nov., Strain RCC2339" /LENGTH=107 /DNA_ID=CAMNT_0007136633 /DNA_START=292 /DNA_END=615 /DNA_ORIENTATION=+
MAGEAGLADGGGVAFHFRVGIRFTGVLFPGISLIRFRLRSNLTDGLASASLSDRFRAFFFSSSTFSNSETDWVLAATLLVSRVLFDPPPPPPPFAVEVMARFNSSEK